ncbi:unnamed protein product [Trichobilharzia regenti]|uniref:adenosine deaminase n=1 Tax=Trichobilharzia regenti TaxID=157069 RepID=A0A183VMM3_TRIRE|nr:unnamed protein product [Trichobilharzia regenti]VDP97608.1 unnamed protein product [Trichobilharzia regenti]
MLVLPEFQHGIDLHVHLDAAARPETLYELAEKERISNLPRDLDEFKKKITPNSPYSVKEFFNILDYIKPLIAGKKDVLARICDEFVEDCVQLGKLCYVETRFCPFTLTGRYLDAEEVLKIVLEKLQSAGEKNRLQVRTILSIMRNMPETAKETLDLAKKYNTHGVVGIDVAGDDSVLERKPVANEIIETFQEAKKFDIHRTVHVGENSSANSVYEAVNTLHAERIGNGYHVVDNEKLYTALLDTGVHFELCPSSSFLTGAVNYRDLRNHPIHRFAKDDANFSINTDGPTLTQRWNTEEASYCMDELGLKYAQVNEANYRAAKAAFLPTIEQCLLVSHITVRTRNRYITIDKYKLRQYS